MKVPKNNILPRKLNESEYEEQIRLRAEIAYIKAENEVIKKRLPWEKKEKLRVSRRKSSDYQNAPPERLSTKVSSESYANVQIYLLFWTL